ncbi:hypothetical protein K8I28_16335 [bacterium]|nr:hypothetical protein [bacterium]
MEYPAFMFKQSKNGPLQVVFATSSADLDKWCKVPTKMASNQRGFQRAEIRTHVGDIYRFFDSDNEEKNISPTAVILGLNPNYSNLIRITDSDDNDIDLEQIINIPTLCKLQVDYNPWDSTRFSSVEEEIEKLFEDNKLISSITPSKSDSDDSESTDDNGNLDSDDDVYDTIIFPPTKEGLLEIKNSQSYKGFEDSEKTVLRDLLKDLLKPGLIIDGQHRIKGTRSIGKVPFIVSFLPYADWAELSFQFIVNNSTSKKVSDGLLISIVGNSLSEEELRSVENRLIKSGIKVALIKSVIKVHEDPNPFQNMLKFDIPGEKGFLEAAAMQRKVVTPWYGNKYGVAQKPRFKYFPSIGEDYESWSSYDLFGNSCKGDTEEQKASFWQESGLWFSYFKSFWEPIKEYFIEESKLWPRDLNDFNKFSSNPQNLKLLRVTILGLLQRAVIQAYGDAQQQIHLAQGNSSMDNFETTEDEFCEQISRFIRRVPSEFFVDLKATGFDASKDIQNMFLKPLYKILSGKKRFDELKGDYDELW